jgi:hypothetical protein
MIIKLSFETALILNYLKRDHLSNSLILKLADAFEKVKGLRSVFNIPFKIELSEEEITSLTKLLNSELEKEYISVSTASDYLHIINILSRRG